MMVSARIVTPIVLKAVAAGAITNLAVDVEAVEVEAVEAVVTIDILKASPSTSVYVSQYFY